MTAQMGWINGIKYYAIGEKQKRKATVCDCVICTRCRTKAKKIPGSCCCRDCRTWKSPNCTKQLTTEHIQYCSGFWSLACADALRSRRPQA